MRNHDAGDRTTLSIRGPLLKWLGHATTERRVSTAELVRMALEEKLASHRPESRRRGIGASGHRDTAREASEACPEPRAWR